jgi:AcrR family transcriptional regulator
MEPAGSDSAKALIRRAGYRLLLTKGFKAATYSAIAEASGCSKALVQHHFPVKARLAVDLVHDLVLAIESYVRLRRPAVDDLTAFRFLVVQLYYGFLLESDVRPFTVDLLSDRAILTDAMEDEVDWNSRILGLDGHADRAVVEQAVVAVGGTYELLYWRLRRGELPDAAELAERLLLGSMAGSDIDSAATRRLFHESAFDPATLAVAVAELKSALRSPDVSETDRQLLS